MRSNVVISKLPGPYLRLTKESIPPYHRAVVSTKVGKKDSWNLRSNSKDSIDHRSRIYMPLYPLKAKVRRPSRSTPVPSPLYPHDSLVLRPTSNTTTKGNISSTTLSSQRPTKHIHDCHTSPLHHRVILNRAGIPARRKSENTPDPL